ncbi:MAG: nuclease [Citromicrobium sp.]|nr:nuclease [Citromicrobium sp.]
MGDLASFRRPSPRSSARTGARERQPAPAKAAESSSWRDAARGLGMVLLVAPLAVFTAVLLVDGAPEVRASAEVPQAAAPPQVVQASFGPCIGGERHTCVVDGDTIWLNDQKIRIADIDAPEIYSPDCPAERALGLRATERLTQWLNAAPFEVHPNPDGRDEDTYGRKLRVLARSGTSAVAVLEAEGLAARWGGRGREWC